jgi:hypothetical protein
VGKLARRSWARGSAIINQAFADVKTGFAFKCFQGASEDVYRAAIQEMSVLGLPLLLDQPNIVQLQGVSFEVTRDENVRPMLVYEKSKHGDLLNSQGLRLERNRDCPKGWLFAKT